MIDIREWLRDDTARLFRVPTPHDDKYTRGVVALRTGSDTYPGAAVLGVEAAWRAGAGFVRYVGDTRVADAVLARRPETVIGHDAGRSRIGAWVIGSGIDAAGRTDAESVALREILSGASPVVVDAGALDLVEQASAPFVITPHAGEFERLQDRLQLRHNEGESAGAAVLRMAEAVGGTVLLKGARTFIAEPQGRLVSVTESTGWLATAGTGDVLAGVIGAIIAANPESPLIDAAAAGTWLHGYAAKLAAGLLDLPRAGTGHPIVALDVAESLPRAIADLLA